MKSYTSALLSLIVTMLATQVRADSTNKPFLILKNDPAVITQGKSLYEQMCAACHSKDLGGAFGFNLKDGEWIHGSEPQQVIDNIKQGFSNAGMPGFAAMFSNAQIESIVAYLFSKREGFSNLSYRLYQMNNADDQQIVASKLLKSGLLPANLADFQIPEIQDYVLEFTGDFYTLKDEPTRIWIEWGRNTDITFEIDGELVKRDNRFGEWVPTWPLKLGQQHLKITYRSGHDKPHMKNLPLIVTNDDMSIKLFPISVKAKGIMEGKKLEIKATNRPLVQRIKTKDLPAFSIAVGLPQKVNFAFNTRSCSIVGMWQGEMLNIGPNISGRGEDPSLPLGDWLFHFPSTLQHDDALTTTCNYLGYHLVAGNPVFNYKLGEVTYSLFATANTAKGIDFHYTAADSAHNTLLFQLPQINKLQWESPLGSLNNDKLKVTTDAHGKFTISANFNEIE